MQAVTLASLGQLSAIQCEKGLQNWALCRKCFRATKSLTPTLASKKLLLSIISVQTGTLVPGAGLGPLSSPRAAGNKWAEVPGSLQVHKSAP